jgi:hypothetical protein
LSPNWSAVAPRFYTKDTVMPAAILPNRLRIISRKSLRPKVHLDQLSPSLLEPGLRGDLWLVSVAPAILALRCNYHTLAHLDGSPLDAMSLNTILYGLRHRFPRKKKELGIRD